MISTLMSPEVSLGSHPSSLVSRMVDEIRQSGPMTFARFMELALYDPDDGYYMTTSVAASPNAQEESRIGWSGDFYTAFDVHPLLTQCLFKQIQECDALLGQPPQFTLVEMGPGKGLFARDLFRECERLDPNLLSRLRYVLIERSPTMRTLQEQNLAEFSDKGYWIQWSDSLSEFASGTFEGMVVSNEFVDALPVHRVAIQGNARHEVFVDFQDGAFCERTGEYSTSEINDYLDAYDIQASNGYRTEVHLASIRWMKEVARVLRRGFVLTIDYGHTAQDYYDASRKDGTLLCYHKHRASSNPYVRVGEQDITAHVNFSALANTGKQAGLSVTGFTNLMNFLLSQGADKMLETLDPESDEMRSAIEFLRPQSMGQTFKILVQHKGVESPTLQGLQFRPYFEGALLEKCATN